MTNIAIFASGRGTNAQKIIEHFAANLQIRVALVLSNNSQAYVLEAAREANIPAIVFNRDDFYQTDTVIQKLQDHHIQWIVLAGFLWLIPGSLIENFPNRIVNIHPALLPKFGGKGMYGIKVHQAVVEAKVSYTGITIHLVNEKYDEGEILFQAQCIVEPNDTPEEIALKVQNLEHIYFPSVIEKVIVENEN